MYPATNLFAYAMAGFKSKNARQRAGKLLSNGNSHCEVFYITDTVMTRFSVLQSALSYLVP